MSVVQSNSNLTLTGITPEVSSRADSTAVDNKKIQQSEQAEKVNQIEVAKEVEKEVEKEAEHTSLSPTQLDKVAQQLQEFVGEMNKSLEFLVDKDSGRDVIKVVDRNTGDLVKQFPSEEVLDLVAKLSEVTGNFVDAKI